MQKTDAKAHKPGSPGKGLLWKPAQAITPYPKIKLAAIILLPATTWQLSER